MSDKVEIQANNGEAGKQGTTDLDKEIEQQGTSNSDKELEEQGTGNSDTEDDDTASSNGEKPLPVHMVIACYLTALFLVIEDVQKVII